MRIGDPCFTSPHVVLSPADGGGFFADVGFISRGYPQINQIFFDFVVTTTIKKELAKASLKL